MGMLCARIANRTALAIALVAAAYAPAAACTAVRSFNRVGGVSQREMLCWTGPCRLVLGQRDTLGRFSIGKREPDAVVDHIIMRVENGSHVQTLVSAVSNPICNPPAGTVSGCTERFKLAAVKACPLGGAPCKATSRVRPALHNLDEVNTLTTGGSLTLADGQVVQGKGDSNYGLFFEVCCPDAGQFGAPGTGAITRTTYIIRRGTDPATCEEREKLVGPPDIIPASTFPCE